MDTTFAACNDSASFVTSANQVMPEALYSTEQFVSLKLAYIIYINIHMI
jgi:hypothetical protein